MVHARHVPGVVHGRWVEGCSLCALAALAFIVAHVAAEILLGVATPYAGGAAVVLGLGAVVCAAARSRGVRFAVASAVLGLLLVRMVSAAMPGVFLRPHGAPALADGVAMALLVVCAGALLVVVAVRR